MATSVRDLLPLLANAQLDPLMLQLDELHSRVKAAEAGADVRPKERSSTNNNTSIKHTSSSASQLIEHVQLPALPADPYGPLPLLDGAHEWEALQEPVNQACHHFKTPAAQAAWKQRTLTWDNTCLAVALAWWTVAHVFNAQHPAAPSVKEHVFRMFTRCYLTHVLSSSGACKDLHHRLWQSVMASATVKLLRSAFPKSTHKLDKHLESFIHSQIMRWTSGPLPADNHPSNQAFVENAAPAALVLYQQHTDQLTRRKQAEAKAKSRHAATMAGTERADESLCPVSVRSAPAALTSASGLDDGFTAKAGFDAAYSSQPTAVRSIDLDMNGRLWHLPSSGYGDHDSDIHQQAQRAGLHLPGESNIEQAPAVKMSPTLQPLDRDHPVHGPEAGQQALVSHQLEHEKRPHSTSQLNQTPVPQQQAMACATVPAGGEETTAGNGDQHAVSQLLRSGFQPMQSSPSVAFLFEQHALGAPRQQEAAMPGVLTRTFGTGQRSRRRALDTLSHAQQVLEQAEEKSQAHTIQTGSAVQGQGSQRQKTSEFTYGSIAKESCRRAADAVARYEACKAATRREVAQMKKQLVVGQEQLHVMTTNMCSGDNAKGLSDRLSHWIESDIDRMLRDQPMAATIAAQAAKGPAAERRTAETHAASTAARSGRKFGETLSATEAVVIVKGGAGAGATALTGAADTNTPNGKPPTYQAMTAATVAGAGCASASFLAHKAAASVGNKGPSLTRVMEPWSTMRNVEARIRWALSQAKHGGSNDIAARMAVYDKEVQARQTQPGLPGNGKHGAAWRPIPIEDCSRGTLDIRLRRRVQHALRNMETTL